MSTQAAAQENKKALGEMCIMDADIEALAIGNDILHEAADALQHKLYEMARQNQLKARNDFLEAMIEKFSSQNEYSMAEEERRTYQHYAQRSVEEMTMRQFIPTFPDNDTPCIVLTREGTFVASPEGELMKKE